MSALPTGEQYRSDNTESQEKQSGQKSEGHKVKETQTSCQK